MKKFLSSLAIFLMGSLLSLGIVYAQEAKTFPDVDYDAYYGTAVSILSSRGVINGYDNGNFGPNDPVTRAQLSAILHRNDTLSPDFSRIMELRELICGALEKDELSTNAETWGDLQAKYQSICESPWYL